MKRGTLGQHYTNSQAEKALAAKCCEEGINIPINRQARKRRPPKPCRRVHKLVSRVGNDGRAPTRLFLAHDEVRRVTTKLEKASECSGLASRAY